MAKHDEEKAVRLRHRLDEIHSLFKELSQSPNPETQRLAHLVMLIQRNLAEEFFNIWIDVADHRKLTGEILTKYNMFVKNVTNFLTLDAIRLLKLENKSEQPKPEQPNPELESLKADVVNTQKLLNDNKDTLEELALLRQKKIQDFIQKLNDEKDKPDD